MSATDLEPPFDATAWEQDLFDYLLQHMQVESAMLGRYIESAEKSESDALRYLVTMLADDERRHHKWFSDLAQAIKSSAELDMSPSPIPYLDLHKHDWESARELISELLANEEQDRTELKRLRKQLRDLEDTTLWPLLVDMMLLDTEKHITMLRFAKRHAKPKR